MVNLATVVDDALKLLRATLPTTIEIRTEFPAALPTVSENPAQIHQIIMNLSTGPTSSDRMDSPGS
ncbi:MAG TPA: hypothetical protein VFN94_00495 [Nitrospiria bacterium]|nr:hypothetical protein [Nitrospiria bacterium]